jgi:hypothetical protein
MGLKKLHMEGWSGRNDEGSDPSIREGTRMKVVRRGTTTIEVHAIINTPIRSLQWDRGID